MLPRERLGHFDQRKVGRPIARVAHDARAETAGRHAAARRLRRGHAQLVVLHRLQERRHRRELVAQAHHVEVAAGHGIARHLDPADDDVDGRGVAGGEPGPAAGDADLRPLLEVVGRQREFLREDRVDLARRIDRRLEEDVGAIGVRQEDLVRANEQIAQAVAVAVAVLDVLEHRARGIFAGGRLPIERIARAGVLLRQVADRVPRAAVLDLDQRDAVEGQLKQLPRRRRRRPGASRPGSDAARPPFRRAGRARAGDRRRRSALRAP